jgi:hypothetical protein
MNFRAAFNAKAAAGLTPSWEVHAGDFVPHLIVTDGKLDLGVGPAPGKPDLVITFQPEGLPSYQALIQAAKCGLVQLDRRREPLDTFLNVFVPPRLPAFPARRGQRRTAPSPGNPSAHRTRLPSTRGPAPWVSSVLTGDMADIRLKMDTHYFGTLTVTRACAHQLGAHGSSAVLDVLSAASPRCIRSSSSEPRQPVTKEPSCRSTKRRQRAQPSQRC